MPSAGNPLFLPSADFMYSLLKNCARRASTYIVLKLRDTNSRSLDEDSNSDFSAALGVAFRGSWSGKAGAGGPDAAAGMTEAGLWLYAFVTGVSARPTTFSIGTAALRFSPPASEPRMTPTIRPRLSTKAPPLELGDGGAVN